LTTLELSNGFLPVGPLLQSEPTAVGEIDLDSPLSVRLNTSETDSFRDQLLLARLHGEPLAVIHLDIAPGDETPLDLARAVWEQSGERLRTHVARYRCVKAPAEPEDLVGGLSADGVCGSTVAARPEGSTAVIVATDGRRDVLERTLTSLLHLDFDEYELILVDNRPGTGTTRAIVERLMSEGPIRYVAEPRQGISPARNAGIRAAENARFVAFTDDDVVADPSWLRWLIASFGDEDVNAATGMVLPHALSATQKRFELYSGFGRGAQREVYDLKHNRADRLLYPFWGGMFGAGNSMAFRRSSLVEVGCFDTALGPGTPTHGGEDIAAFTDIILHGGKLTYEPRSILWHEHRQDEEALRQQAYNYGVGLTATLTRYAVHDRRFLAAAVRSIPLMAKLLLSRRGQRAANLLPHDLSSLEMRGRLSGPWRYTRSRRINRPTPGLF
jgi:glycosyltransferase involved in cell wall biosynthesis